MKGILFAYFLWMLEIGYNLVVFLSQKSSELASNVAGGI
jgi:hypothetical protein